MTTPEIILLCVVLGIGCPAAMRNLTSLALVASYGFGMGIWLATGLGLPTGIMFLADVTVLMVIYCKPEAHECFPYTGLGHQLCSLWLERSVWDRVVIGCFPVMWIAYAFAPPFELWWTCWVLSIFQFFAAAGEPLSDWRTAKRQNRQDESHSTSGLMFAQARSGGAYG